MGVAIEPWSGGGDAKGAETGVQLVEEGVRVC